MVPDHSPRRASGTLQTRWVCQPSPDPLCCLVTQEKGDKGEPIRKGPVVEGLITPEHWEQLVDKAADHLPQGGVGHRRSFPFWRTWSLVLGARSEQLSHVNLLKGDRVMYPKIKNTGLSCHWHKATESNHVVALVHVNQSSQILSILLSYFLAPYISLTTEVG
jgi:hypothetical protein